MTPGIHPNIPADVYHQWDYASASRLSKLARSPAHLRWSIDHPEEPTPALALGTAFHCLALQPEEIGKTFALAPECDRRTTAGKATWSEFCEKSAGKTPIKSADYTACLDMAVAVRAHPAAARLLADPGPVEVSAVWNAVPNFDRDEVGVTCKLRADKLARDFDSVVDLKTTDDASPEGFERSILKYGYHRQAAFYLHGLAALGVTLEHFVFVCVEKDPPHAVGVYRLDDDAVEAGWAECIEHLETYAECVRTGKWPGYSTVIQTISVPSWHLRRSGVTA